MARPEQLRGGRGSGCLRRVGTDPSSNRGARIRTGDLTDPNGARYQAAPRPEEEGTLAEAAARHRLEVPDGEPGHERLEARLQRDALVGGVAGQAGLLDGDGLRDDVVDELGERVGEVRADRVERRVGQAGEERAGVLLAHGATRTVADAVLLAIGPLFPGCAPRARAGTVAPVPRLADVIAHLDALLDPAAFADVAPNGLQVPGADEVARVATAVSASEDVLVRAAAAGAGLVLVHHGLWWTGMPQGIGPALHRRLKPLFAGEIALAAYHLPLDAHPEVGNNALLARALGGTELERFADLGFGARVDVAAAELRDRVARATGREPLHLAFGPDRVRSVAVVTGAAASYLERAIAEGYDAFVTGEPAERVFAQAREAGVHVFGAGHHATETFGVRALGDLLAAEFGVEHLFLDEPNPI